MTFHLCVSCDALRDVERCFCQNCGEATNSYLYEPSEREEFELLALANAGRIVGSVPRVSFTEVLPDPFGRPFGQPAGGLRPEPLRVSAKGAHRAQGRAA